MTYLRLRIAWSVAWGVVAVLLMTLWAWSYWENDFAFKVHSPEKPFGSELTASIGTYEGTLYVWHGYTGNLSLSGGSECDWESGDPANWGKGWRVLAPRDSTMSELDKLSAAWDVVVSNSTRSEQEKIDDDWEPMHLAGRFHWITSSSGDTLVSVPQWLPILLAAVSAGLPWTRWSKRFSLRTLLIATTLIAVMLGLIVWRR